MNKSSLVGTLPGSDAEKDAQAKAAAHKDWSDKVGAEMVRNLNQQSSKASNPPPDYSPVDHAKIAELDKCEGYNGGD